MQIRVWVSDDGRLLVESDQTRPVEFARGERLESSAYAVRTPLVEDVRDYVECLLAAALRDADAARRAAIDADRAARYAADAPAGGLTGSSDVRPDNRPDVCQAGADRFVD